MPKSSNVAHAPDCQCTPCGSVRPNLYVAPEPHDWQADAALAGEMHRDGVSKLWNAAYLIARSCEPSKGGRPTTAEVSAVSSGRVSFREFAREAGDGISDKTVARYYATWQSAAGNGWVPKAEALSQQRQPRELTGLTDEQWDTAKPKVSALPSNTRSSSNQSSRTKASGARAAAPSAPDHVPGPTVELVTADKNAELGEPAPLPDGVKALWGDDAPKQHPLREAEGSQLKDALLSEFATVRTALTLIKSIDDKVLTEVCHEPDIAEFMSEARKLASRISKIRKAVSK